MTLLLVAGYPATGKSTLARHLSLALGWPLVAKDVIKEALFDSLGTGDVEWSNRLGRAAMHVLHAQVEAVLVAGQSVIAEANFDADLTSAWLRGLDARLPSAARGVVQVVLQAPGDVVVARYVARTGTPERHPGHRDHEVVERLRDLVRRPYRPPELAHERVEVDVTDLAAVDLAEVTVRVQDAIRRCAVGA